MSKKYKISTGIGVGVSSVLMIFVALALTIFATLAYLSARSDIKLTEKSVKSITDYYKADLEAEEIIKELANSLNSEENPHEINSVKINYLDNNYIDFQVKIDDIRVLFVELEYKSNILVKHKWEVTPLEQNIIIDVPLNLM